MWWQDFLWGAWNGVTAWIVLIVHVFGGWDDQLVYDPARGLSVPLHDVVPTAGSPFRCS